jgi:hypothetical protein
MIFYIEEIETRGKTMARAKKKDIGIHRAVAVGIIIKWDVLVEAETTEDATQASRVLSAYTRSFKIVELLNIVPDEDKDAFQNWLFHSELQSDGSLGR